tara:strand:- start:5488 stop:7545 length:2058 start_codon:yes stop_codon:yes gene_type:complete
MILSLYNRSPLPRQHWGVVTTPSALSESLPTECTFDAGDGRKFRAVRGVDRGCKTVWRIYAHMDGHEMITGTLLPVAHAEAGPTLTPHPWVRDDIKELIPTFGAAVGGGMINPREEKWADPYQRLELIEQSPAHQRWLVTCRIPDFGLHMWAWVDLLHLDAVLPFRGKIIWSHRADPNHERTFASLVLKAGELISLDWHRRNPIGEPQPIRKNWVRELTQSPVTIRDGAGLPLSGNMLAFVEPDADPDLTDPKDPNKWIEASRASLLAGAKGGITGTCHDWDGNFLACGNVPRYAKEYVSDLGKRWDRHVADMRQRADWYVDRPYGTTRTPSRTGDQEDFGATHAEEAVTEHDPRWIEAMQYSAEGEIFRGFHHFEDDGEPLQVANHPKWTTWSGHTHWHRGVSGDRLGKRTDVGPGSPNGWQGYDDQHRSQNLVTAYMALTDDPLFDDHVMHHTTTDEAAYYMKYASYAGAGAPRGQGRTAGALAQLLSVTDGEVHARISKVLAYRMLQSKTHAVTPPAPMRVIGSGPPDSRKQVYEKSGKLGRYTSMWEHGLAAVGIYNAHKIQPDANTSEVLTVVCEFLANFGFWKDPTGVYWTTGDLLWDDGAAPWGGMGNRKAVDARPDIGGVLTWTFAGILVAREFLGDAHPRAAAMDEYLATVNGGREAMDRRRGHWYAAIKDITFGA